MAWNYSNTSVETTLTAGINSSVTTISVGSTAGLPATFPFTLVLDFEQATVEVVTVTALAGLNLTVTRGQDGTAAQSHNTGARVVHAIVARDVKEPQDHIAASGNVHGLTGGANVVGTNQSQTLTNKVISGSDNTLSNIPDSALVAIAAAKVTQPFARVRGVGADGTQTVLDIVGDEGSRSAEIAKIARGTAGLLVSSIADVIVDESNLIVDVGGTALTALGRVVSKRSTLPAFVARRDSSSTTVDLQKWQNESGTDLARVTGAGVLIGTGATVNGNLSVTGTASVTGTSTLGVVSAGAVTGTDFLVGTRSIPTETVRRFTNASARDAAITSPVEGMLVYLQTENRFEYYNGSAWTVLDKPGWTSYTPVWTTTGSAPSIGNGTISGSWRRNPLSDIVTVRGRLVAGSTTTFGTASWLISLPINVDETAEVETVGPLFMTDLGTANRSGTCVPTTDNDKILCVASSGDVTNVNPHTWANGDILRWTIAYQPA